VLLALTVSVPAEASFAPAAGSPFAAGGGTQSMAIGDLNFDGRPDLVVANFSDDTLTVLRGNGSGGFTPAPGAAVATGDGPASVAIGDLNADGRPDLAVANLLSDNVSVLLGTASGNGFAPATPVAAGDGPRTVAIADLNGNGRLDIVVSNENSGNVSIALGNGSGGFAAAAGSPLSTGAGRSVTVGDLNGDGRPDLAVPVAGFELVTLLTGNGSGGFTSAVDHEVPTGSLPSSVAIGDLNHDGNADLAIANEDSNNVSVLLGNGSGGFAVDPGSPFAAGDGPVALASADLNADGHPDLAVADSGSDGVTVLNGDGSGGFASAGPVIPAGDLPKGLAIADLNADSRPDIAVSSFLSHNVTVLLNTSAPVVTRSAAELIFPSQAATTIGDAQPLTITNTGDAPLRIARADVVGADADDFVVGTDTCSRETLPAAGACSVRVRFAPTAPGARAATLRLTSNAATSDVALSGTAVVPPSTERGPAGAGGQNGARGPAGPRGAPGRDAKVTCKVAPRKGKKVKVTCKVVLAAPKAGSRVSARLMRGGRVYARASRTGGRGRLELRPVRRLTRGRYTLRVLVIDPGGTRHRSTRTVVVH
jgi:hypothetical protein